MFRRIMQALLISAITIIGWCVFVIVVTSFIKLTAIIIRTVWSF
jgi:hypothetical protein